MVGITLSPAQIRRAPPEVRRWLEQELFGTFGLQPSTAELHAPQLAALSVDEAAAVLSLVQGMLPVVNVFLELGREGIDVDTGGLAAFRLTDIVQHTRLQTLDQALACLDGISAAARRVRGDAEEAFYGLDRRGHCFISAETQRSIRQMWQQIITARDLDASSTADNRSMTMPTIFPSGMRASAPSCPISSAPVRTTNEGSAEVEGQLGPMVSRDYTRDHQGPAPGTGL
jgi:hypothetical protein